MNAPERCGTCEYYREVSVGMGCEIMTACAYVIVRGRRRPCPPGGECTVYEAAKG